jgi:Resolvase, N terminal domain
VTPSKRAALYARVSTVNGQRPEVQLNQLRQYCQQHNFQVVGEYVDHGVSGAKASRPELDRLMQDARDHKFDAIIVYKLDRFGRLSSVNYFFWSTTIIFPDTVNIDRSRRGCGKSGNPAHFAGFPSEVGKSRGLFHGASFPQPFRRRFVARRLRCKRPVSSSCRLLLNPDFSWPARHGSWECSVPRSRSDAPDGRWLPPSSSDL